MPRERIHPTQTEDQALRNGMKGMFAKIGPALLIGSRLSTEDFAMIEDDSVDGFILGLRLNGYDIVKT